MYLFDEGLDEFFGCGGFSTNTDAALLHDDAIDDDEVGTIRSKIELQQLTSPDMDIENLGKLASTMLHLNGAARPSRGPL